MINTIEDVMKLTKEQLRELSVEDKEKVKAILEAEIEKILKRSK